MATSTITRTGPQASGRQVRTRGRSIQHPVLGWLWNALAELGKQRAHREIAFLLQAHGGQVTGNFDRDLQRYTELSVVRVGPKQDRC
jgi:hypothetical protein